MFGSLLEPLSATRQLLIDGLIATLILAVLVAILSETLRSGLQQGVRQRMFRQWWDQRTTKGWNKIPELDLQAFADLWKRLAMPSSATPIIGLGETNGVKEFHDNAVQACELPNELFMRKIENMGRAVLERPGERPDLFIALTAGCASTEQLMVLRFDQVLRFPAYADAAAPSEPQAVPPAVLAAQDRAASALDRNLDDLQLLFAKEWPVLLSTTSFMIGIMIAVVVAFFVNGFSSVGYIGAMVTIGAVAGLLAAVGRDSASRFFDERRPS